ncbi:MAG TPA: cytochrome c oxidase subunit 3, partial [Candidatus Paceibacterota bacterium]|nr:cytochrome c oxidase subunit 3 [Candidatus Paceibacterota bacterium]
ATFLLGLAFLGLELHEFAGLIAEGHGWQQSAFLSSFFTLVGTHGLHIFVGLLWLIGIFIHLAVRGVSKESSASITYFSLFWHFLDIVWICIFSFVYLFGSL